MNPREKLSVILISLGFILALLPLSTGRTLVARPQKVLDEILDPGINLTADQVAALIASDDHSIQLIDLRSKEEFRNFNIPGSINIPYGEFLNSDPHRILSNGKSRTIFYSNGDVYSNYALTIARGLNYRNTFVLRGGLNAWFNTVMNSTFNGERISARENALFESRFRARKIFTEINSLPDSLKQKYFDSRRLAAKKLDGGCE